MDVKEICKKIKTIAEKTSRAAFPSIPAIVMLCSLAKRPGLSTIMSVINIVQAMKERGIPTEANPDGTPNLIVQLTYCMVDEIYRAIREDANGQTATAPMAINIQAQGGNAGGPVVVTGGNILPFKSVTMIS